MFSGIRDESFGVPIKISSSDGQMDVRKPVIFQFEQLFYKSSNWRLGR